MGQRAEIVDQSGIQIRIREQGDMQGIWKTDFWESRIEEVSLGMRERALSKIIKLA